ncbi:MAG: YaiO family outer membrane beta-barrel protein [Tsuneonella suprasediminis]|nr:YaiO family outer membrane beta-barrel protein [Tsuneonella suprasediminis]UBS31814.1 YaiO family outer membrane beta-barrel protein [Altererythrobacter sp. N1]
MRVRANARFLALLLLGCPAVAWGQDGDPRIEDAQRAAEAGDRQEAVRLLEELNRERPDNPETLRLLGAAYASVSRYEEAISTLREAQVLAPDDQDIALALGRARLWSGDIGGAREEAARIRMADPNNVELPALEQAIERTSTAPGGRRAGVAVGQAISTVAIGGSDRTWRNTTVAVDVPVGSAWTIVGDADVEDRSGVADTRLSLRLDRRLGGGNSVYLAGSVTPDADFREDWSLKAGAVVTLTPNLVASLDLRHADYGTTNVTVAEPGVRIQSGDGAYALSLHSINLWAEGNVHQSGWSLRGQVPLPKSATLSLGASTYPDTEAGITRRVRGAFVGVVVPLSDRVTLRVVGDHEQRVDTYRRTGIAVSLHWRFGR